VLLLTYGLILLTAVLVGFVLTGLAKTVKFDYTVEHDYLRARRAEATQNSVFLRLIDPLVRAFSTIVRRLPIDEHKARVRRLLVHAGSPWGYTAEEYVGYGLTLVVLTYGVLLVTFMVATGGIRPFHPLLPALGAYGFAILNLKSKADKRRMQVDRDMPFLLDLVSLTMGAGATFLQACESVVQHAGEGPLVEELDQMLHEVRAGTPLREAVRNLTKRSDSPELAIMVAAVTQAEELGTPLVEIFETQASMNRFRRTKTAEKIAAKIPNRLAVPTIFLMLAVLLLLFGPIIVKAVRGEIL
jgi:tight adherence protein C